jgi:hypothetical protein
LVKNMTDIYKMSKLQSAVSITEKLNSLVPQMWPIGVTVEFALVHHQKGRAVHKNL